MHAKWQRREWLHGCTAQPIMHMRCRSAFPSPSAPATPLTSPPAPHALSLTLSPPRATPRPAAPHTRPAPAPTHLRTAAPHSVTLSASRAAAVAALRPAGRRPPAWLGWAGGGARPPGEGGSRRSHEDGTSHRKSQLPHIHTHLPRSPATPRPGSLSGPSPAAPTPIHHPPGSRFHEPVGGRKGMYSLQKRLAGRVDAACART